MELSNIKTIIEILKKIKKPVAAEEIAFRVRSTRAEVEDLLAKLIDVNIVKKEGELYYLAETKKNTEFEIL